MGLTTFAAHTRFLWKPWSAKDAGRHGRHREREAGVLGQQLQGKAPDSSDTQWGEINMSRTWFLSSLCRCLKEIRQNNFSTPVSL